MLFEHAEICDRSSAGELAAIKVPGNLPIVAVDSKNTMSGDRSKEICTYSGTIVIGELRNENMLDVCRIASHHYFLSQDLALVCLAKLFEEIDGAAKCRFVQ